jgi:hypothetical protein
VARYGVNLNYMHAKIKNRLIAGHISSSDETTVTFGVFAAGSIISRQHMSTSFCSLRLMIGRCDGASCTWTLLVQTAGADSRSQGVKNRSGGAQDNPGSLEPVGMPKMVRGVIKL